MAKYSVLDNTECIDGMLLYEENETSQALPNSADKDYKELKKHIYDIEKKEEKDVL